MKKQPKSHAWRFTRQFRRHAFGWKSHPAIERVGQAVAEIRRVGRVDPLLASEGAVAFLERVSPALENVDSSSGAIGAALNQAIEDLVPIIASAPADPATRSKWLDRLWEACQEDQVPYIESLGEHWGELCALPEVAGAWADRLVDLVRLSWSPDPQVRGYFGGTTHCLSAMLAAGRHDELLQLLELDPHPWWTFRQFGVRALAAAGRTDEAIEYAERGRAMNDSEIAIAQVCEEVLLSAGREADAYERYGLLAHRARTYVAWYRAVAARYPQRRPRQILADLVRFTPGDEGKWFAAAKDAGLHDEALALARSAPCDPKTLTRAARDFAMKRPAFAVEAGLLALEWLAEGHGYEVTTADAWHACAETMRAAEQNGTVGATSARIREIAARDRSTGQIVQRALGPALARALGPPGAE